MLQRAASNAYSWWWASHIRTKQSKWMEQNLQDMEEKVQVVLKLIEEDGDSFAKRAEMYYKKRPELIHFVEESYRAYRALAERYDHISTELQNANGTIASIFPDQAPFMDDDYEEASPRAPRKLPEGFKPNIPNVPKPPIKNFKSAVTTATKKLYPKKTATAVASPKGLKSGLSRKETLEEIEKLQKQILALQTVKEFVKSSYDNAIARYWETEEQIKELQERVFSLQDELGEGIIIEDNEARRLMAEAALKSCQETLTQLQEKQEKSINETRIETTKIKDVKEKLESLMDEFQYNQINQKELRAKRDVKEGAEVKDFDEDVDRMTQQRQDLQLLQEKIKEHFEAGSYSSLSVTEMAEKIDELVNKVISLETAVSSQTALVKRLRTDTDELQSQIQTLENDKASLLNDKTKLNNQLTEMEEKMRGVQDLNQIVESQNTNLQTHFTEARCNLDHLSEKVQNVQPDEGIEVMYYSHRERKSSGEVEPKYKVERQEALNQENVLLNDANSDKEFKVTGFVQDDVKSDNKLKVTGFVEDDVKSDNKFMVTSSLENDVQTDNELKVTDTQKMEEAHPVEMELPRELKEQEETMNLGNGDEKAVDALSTSAGIQDVSQHQARNEADSSSESSEIQQEIDAKAVSSETQNFLKVYAQEKVTAPEGEPNWQQLFMNGLQDREKVLLLEYTNTLRNFKDVKKQLTEVEKKYQGYFDTSLQLKELKHANVLKDEEIRFLHQKLVLLQGTFEGKEEVVELTSPMPTEKQDIEAMLKFEEPNSTSAIEEKFRMSIDEILEENLEFWLKFSTSITKIQKFETTIKDLLTEVSKLEEKGKSSEDSSSTKYSLKSDVRPIYQHLVEIQTELTVWLEKSALLKEELKCRFSSFCDIQEEITQALKASAEDDDFKFTSYQAAKFQGEILNMKQENNRVAAELQAGLDHVTTLQLDVEKVLAELIEKFGLTTSKRQQSSNMRQTESWNRVPLGSFIFGVKPKKQKQSIFSCMTPGMHKKYRSRDKSHM